MAMNDKSTIEVLVTSAVNDAIAKVKDATEAKSRDILQNIERNS